jgi:putative transposase
MQPKLLFEDKDLGRALQEMREVFVEELPTEATLKGFLEGLLREERAAYLAAAPQERTPKRRGWRNGHYTRDLGTERGLIRGLRVPRVRDGGFRSKVLTRYRRRRPLVDNVLRDCFLSGVSTRRVGPCVKGLLGEAVSASTVSRVCACLTREVVAFHRRSLTDRYRYLFLDAMVFQVRGVLSARRRTLLCALGITLEGCLEVIDFRLVRGESEGSWTAFLNDLYHRGLLGRFLGLIVSDGNPGLLAALEMVYPFAGHQRCWFHKMQNVAGQVRKRDREAVVRGARRIYLAQSRGAASGAFWRWAKRWRETYPQAVGCIQRDLQELLAHFKEPPKLRPTLRTTNPIERAFREVRRRTRPMTVVNSDESIERVAYSVFHHLNNQWERHPRKVSTQNS